MPNTTSGDEEEDEVTCATPPLVEAELGASAAEGDEVAARVAVSATGYADAMTTDVVWFSYQLD